MTENVEFDKTTRNGMIIEMRRYGIDIRFIGRSLYRRKKMDIHVPRHDHDARRMSPCRPFCSNTAVYNTLDKTVSLLFSFSLIKFSGISIRRLILDGCDRTRAIHVIPTEKLLRVFMRDRLIYAGKIKIDIGNLVSVKTEKYGKRNIMTVFFQRLAANRTIFVRKVEPGTIRSIRNEFAVFALRAAPMRRKWIDFRDVSHRRDKGRPDRTSRTDKIPIQIRFFDELMRNQIQHGKTMTDNRRQFLVKTGLYHSGQIFPVHFMRTPI